MPLRTKCCMIWHYNRQSAGHCRSHDVNCKLNAAAVFFAISRFLTSTLAPHSLLFKPVDINSNGLLYQYFWWCFYRFECLIDWIGRRRKSMFISNQSMMRLQPITDLSLSHRPPFSSISEEIRLGREIRHYPQWDSMWTELTSRDWAWRYGTLEVNDRYAHCGTITLIR